MAGGDDLWIVGVVLVLAGSIGQNLGNNLMSLGHEQQRQLDSVKKVTEKADSEENKDNDATIAARADIESGVAKAEGEKMEDKEEEKGTWWFIGTVCFVVGSLSTFVAFGFGAQSLLAALESIQFVTNVIFAKTVHNEAVTVRMLLSTTAIVLGCVLVVVFSPHGDSTLTGEDVQRLLIKTPFIIWIVFSFIGWCCAEYTYLYYKKARLVEGRRLWKHSMIEPLCYCLASALVGALAVVGAKCLSMLIIYHPDVEFVKPTVYITLFVWLGLVFYWLRRLDYGFELYPPLFVIPVIQVSS